MRYYFEERTNKKFVGRKSTIVNTTRTSEEQKKSTQIFQLHHQYLFKSTKHSHKSEEQKALIDKKFLVM